MKIIIAGDVVPNRRTLSLFQRRDVNFLFGDILDEFLNADLRIVNLEAPVLLKKGKKIKKHGPSLCCTKETMESLKDIGVNVITLANNHYFDYGQSGVEDTIISADSVGIKFVGGGRDITAARQVLYYPHDEGYIAILNVCEHEFSIATRYQGGSNPFDILNLEEDIIEAKKRADTVIVIIHGGLEMYQYPTPRMRRLYRHFIDVGASVIVNHHQHCMSGYEVYKDAPIFYGIGNFCFDSFTSSTSKIWHNGYFVRLIIKNEIKFELIPYIQCLDTPQVVRRNTDEFNNELFKLNKIIQNEELLENEFQNFSRIWSREYIGSFLPFGRCLMAFYRRGLLGRIYSEKQLLRIYNIHSCESKKELIDRVLNNFNYNKL